ncbi:MAG: alanyl-tRNA editing protein [Candidatus Woesearchaeota archaeon]
MTKLIYLEDAYLKEATAKIVKINNNEVILDKTIFYPNSGGQLNDVGSFLRLSVNKKFNVINCIKKDGEVIHILEENNLSEGDELKINIDWNRRYKLMRYHTTAHLISGIFSKKTNAKITGNQLYEDKGRIDFNLDNFNRELIENLISEANELIKKDLDIKTYYITKDELLKNPDLIKLSIGFNNNIDKIRIVEIDNFDSQPDAGTHVKKLSEIGKINLLKIENKGKMNRRVYFTLE